MNKRALLVLLVLLLASLACDTKDLPDFIANWLEGGDAQRTFSEEVKTYPVNLKGSAVVVEPWDKGSCTMTGTAKFYAGDDGACQLVVSFPMTSLIDGNCVPNGDTKAWQLQGTFQKGYQVCRFDHCNDRPDAYSAGGFIRFYPTSSDAGNNLSCTLIKDGKKKVTIEVPALAP